MNLIFKKLKLHASANKMCKFQIWIAIVLISMGLDESCPKDKFIWTLKNCANLNLKVRN